METLITFSFNYRADNGSMSGKLERSYTHALTSYKDYSEFLKYIVREMCDWYRNFPFATRATVDDAGDDSDSPQKGDIVSLVPVAADVGSPDCKMSDREEKEDATTAACAYAAAAAAAAAADGAGEAATAAGPDPRLEKCNVHCNKFAGLLNAVPTRACKRFCPHNLNHLKHCMRYRIRYCIRYGAENIRCVA